jgi:hypothetical protein|tara:strand:+ start:432 stop:536 length:105 start_codon:yes stop_codon:yes gene_type:complete
MKMTHAEAKYKESRLMIFAGCYIFTVVAVVLIAI